LAGSIKASILPVGTLAGSIQAPTAPIGALAGYVGIYVDFVTDRK